jgi:hypothetical protein
MPIMLDERNGTFVLVCLNNHRTDDGGSTMRAIEDWLSVPTMAAPGGPSVGRDKPNGLALRCYHCDVCGYVEMYMPPGASPKASNG